MTKTTSPRIGYAGTGVMGASMACRLLQGGYAVRAFNRTKASPHYLRVLAQGGVGAETLDALAAESDVLFSCLDDGDSVFAAGKAILPRMPKGGIWIDMTTIGRKAAVALGEKAAKAGVRFLDAPVSGGDVGARDGTLAIMAGGEEEAFAAVLPLLKLLGGHIRLCGPVGSGQALKLVNQLLCAANLSAVCEAFAAAGAMDVDPALVVEVCGAGAAGSRQLSLLGKKMTEGDFRPGFKIRHMEKDLRLLFEEIECVQAEIARFAYDKFRRLAATNEYKEAGTQALWTLYEREA
jgi:3-hydroxyisobutyrate dehydrogenase